MKLFLDTSVLYAVYSRNSRSSVRLWFDLRHSKYSSEYALKELRRVLERAGFQMNLVNNIVDEVRQKCSIVRPVEQHFRGIRLEDKSDAPIVAGARACGAVLVTLDRKLYSHAKKFVETAFPEEIP